MKTINFNDIEMKGELAVRSGLNFTRLEGFWYRPEEVYGADKHGWPADWEGRILLALTLLSQSTHRTPAYLDEIVSMIPEHLNEKGYLGRILPEGQLDEQQLAGHSWFLRALIEYYKMKKDEEVKSIVEGIVRKLLLPAKGKYCLYPIDPETRFQSNEVWQLSKLQSKSENHAESSDAGCGFIMLDGATAAYEFLGWPELKELIKEMINRYTDMDFVKLHIQTHATLSATRGILRFYEITKEGRYLELAIKMFDLYKTEAWSEAYGNYNWFGTPRWTEPCAIIDSFMVAVNLWSQTENQVYLEDAHRIYFNAISHAHRSNGAFGTDRCVGAIKAEDNMNIAPITYEVHWCCTMRGGEGFSRAIEYNFFTDNGGVYMPFYNNCTATLEFDDGYIKIEERTKYPYYGDVSLEILETTLKSAKKFNFFAPSWTDKENIKVYINGNPVKTVYSSGFIAIEEDLKAGEKIEFDLGLSLRVEESVFKNSIKGYHKFFYGPMLLGYKAESRINTDVKKLDENNVDDLDINKYKAAGVIKLSKDAQFERIDRSRFKVKDSEIVLSSLCDVKELTNEDTIRQILFKD